ncbi:MAG: Glutaredoxin-like protein, YruB-family [Candidatus Jorgensenbacteria bacterium GW2011_GWA2_45_13]|uniref:Glutaredoxin-like protein, YruB-family n=1 Tax=Candidatus Jorgensenbacteria bacterium GW2011_GWA2_45_13 TaxID=1618662 RepID=A0A0G1L765_9BACT|nr:MAG: Glutaredoxin-like protein, YruB-family [Candidatus Jorgensenbacteria bacterium GW2011_GWA2_45_13]
MAKVTIYTTPTCVYCKMTKAFFKENNVQYEEKDVSIDRAAADEMIKKSNQMGVPVIDIDGQILVGFDKEGLSRLLNINEKSKNY